MFFIGKYFFVYTACITGFESMIPDFLITLLEKVKIVHSKKSIANSWRLSTMDYRLWSIY